MKKGCRILTQSMLQAGLPVMISYMTVTMTMCCRPTTVNISLGHGHHVRQAQHGPQLARCVDPCQVVDHTDGGPETVSIFMGHSPSSKKYELTGPFYRIACD